MANMLAVWGFDSVIAGGVDNGVDLPAASMERINAAAKARGIDPGCPSDALDASRDLIIDEGLGAPWSIVGDALCVAYDGIPLDAVEAAAA